MNIFILHQNPIKAAQMLCDKHVSKMILETAQMLSTVARALGHEDEKLYQTVHPKHPCTLWTGKSYHNWRWLCVHGLAMSSEFSYRYENFHKSAEVIEYVFNKKLSPENVGDKMTPFAQAMPEEYKDKNAVAAYRRYYLNDKKRFAKWTKRDPPFWWKP